MRGSLMRHRWPGRYRWLTAAAVTGLMTSGVIPATATASTSGQTTAAASTSERAAAATAGTPVTAATADGSVAVFVRHPNGSLHRRVRDADTGEWRNWVNTGGKAVGNPAVAQNLNGRLEVFVRRADNRLWRQRQSAGGGWGTWQDMGTPPNTTVAGRPVVVANNNTFSHPNPDSQGRVRGNTDGRLELFVRGGDGGLWHRAQSAPNGTGWSPWERLGANRVGNPTAVVTADGRIALFSRTANGHLWHRAQKHPGTQQTPLPADNWSKWQDLGDGYTGDIAVGTNQTTSGTLLQVFGNRSDGRLWTLTQSAPGTSSSPNGTWDTAHMLNLGPALAGPPVVAANSDGRLTLFGVNANHLAAYRSQTESAEPGTNPNGIWEGGWATLGRRQLQSVTARLSSRGGFEVFGAGNGSTTLYQRGQLAAGTPSSPRGVWVRWADLAPIGSGRCAGPGTLHCLNLTNIGLGLAADLEDPAEAHPYIVRSAVDPANPPRQRWSLHAVPDSNGAKFTIVHNNGKCIDEKSEFLGPWHLQLLDCVTGKTAQQWTLEPVTPNTTSDPTAYRIRQVSNPDVCLTALKDDYYDPGGAFHDSRQLERISCETTNPNFHNTWRLGRGTATAPGVLDFALNHAAEQCAADSKNNSCTFVDVTTPSAYQANGGCVVGSVLYNGSTRPADYTAGWARTSGSEWAVAGTLAFNFSDFFSTQFTTSHAWVEQDTFTESVKVTVPRQRFGWVEYAPVVRQAIGHWKITLGGRSWTVPGRSLSVAKNGTNGVNDLRVARTASVPPIKPQCTR